MGLMNRSCCQFTGVTDIVVRFGYQFFVFLRWEFFFGDVLLRKSETNG